MLALALVLLAAPIDQHQSFRVSGSPEVAVMNIAGTIRVEAASDGEVSVRASSDDAGDYTPRIRQQDGVVEATVCFRGHCRGDEWHGERHHDGELRGHIDFTLRVPAGTRVAAKSISGPIEVSGVRGEQALKTVSGNIASDGSEARVVAKSVSGDVKLAPARVAETRVKTVSGEVVLRLPRSAGANVSLKSVSGTLEGAREEERHGRWGFRPHRRQQTVVRGGGPEIDVKTVSGSVRLADR